MIPPIEALFWTTHLDTNLNPLFLALKLCLWFPFGSLLVVIRLLGCMVILPSLLLLMTLLPSFRLPSAIRSLLLLFIGIRFKYVLALSILHTSLLTNPRPISRVEGAEYVQDVWSKSHSFIVACNHRTAFGTSFPLTHPSLPPDPRNNNSFTNVQLLKKTFWRLPTLRQ